MMDKTRTVILTCILDGGPDVGITGLFTEEQIAEIQNMLDTW